DRRVAIETMDLIEVDIIRAEALQAGVDRRHDVFARQTADIGRGIGGRTFDRKKYLGRNDGLIARQHFLYPAPGYDFTGTIRIHIGGVEEIDAGFDGELKKRTRVVGIQNPRMQAIARVAETHATETQARNFEAGAAQRDVIHFSVLSFMGLKEKNSKWGAATPP